MKYNWYTTGNGRNSSNYIQKVATYDMIGKQIPIIRTLRKHHAWIYLQYSEKTDDTDFLLRAYLREVSL